MKRLSLLLGALGALLVVALFWVLLLQPQRDQLADVEEEIAFELDEQSRQTQEIRRREAARTEAPELEAQLATAEAIVPREAALPSALRQLQLAADEAGLVLQSVSTGRPDEFGEEGLSAISLQVQLVGGYFQVVDFLRRVEDPAITPRGVSWASASLTRGEYPELNVSLSGTLYAVVEEPAPDEEPEDDPEEGDDIQPDDGDDDDIEAELDPAAAPDGEVRP